LQIIPNASHILKRWQLPAFLWDIAAEPTSLTVHRCPGEVLAQERSFDKKIRAKHGAPFVEMHRVDLRKAMFQRAVDLGVDFYFGQRLESINFARLTVTTLAGHSFSADLVIAADGLWSRCREIFLGVKDEPLPTGDLAYRIVLSAMRSLNRGSSVRRFIFGSGLTPMQ
jgi:salicylate hydroxylase